MRSAIRMSALSQAGVIYVMTHDSIGLGEDGPTHQVHSRHFSCVPLLAVLASGSQVAYAADYQLFHIPNVTSDCAFHDQTVYMHSPSVWW